MGDPITMAMIGAGVGAMTNPRKPLQGALLGGALGGVGGSFMGGAMGAGNAAATTAMTGANPAVMGTAGMGVAPMTAGATYNAAAPGMVANFGNATMPTYAATGGSTGLIGSTTAPVAMADRFAGGMNALKSDISSLGTFAKENPLAAGQGLQAAKGVLFPEPMAAPPAPGLLRGTPSQEQPPQYAMGMPQINLLG
jgi:hypothetical protein